MIGVFVLFIAVAALCRAEVVVLDSKNFEHLTQASSGSTTGDWLVKFYAPWCGHCKKLEPTYESVSRQLEGVVNVAKVDVTANRDLGTRFEIQGFPTIKLLSKGKVYTFKGRRSAEEIVEFAKGGYKIHEAEAVKPPLGIFGEIRYVYEHAYKQAKKDLKSGRFFTMDVFLTFLPVLFGIATLILVFIPLPAPEQREQVKYARREQSNEEQNSNAAPPTSRQDTSHTKAE